VTAEATELRSNGPRIFHWVAMIRLIAVLVAYGNARSIVESCHPGDSLGRSRVWASGRTYA